MIHVYLCIYSLQLYDCSTLMFNFNLGNATIEIPGRSEKISMRIRVLMNRIVFALSFLLMAVALVSAQPQARRVSEDDDIPVIIKHLPEWETVQGKAVLIKNTNDLRQALGERPVFGLIDFEGGTEAVAAPYEAGKLL